MAFVMNRRVPSQSRAIRVLLLYTGSLGLLALLMSTEVWWFDAAYLAVVFAVLLAMSGRTVLLKLRSSDANDVTKHGPGAAYPDRLRRWLTDDYSHEKRLSH
jgi:hypothetical protein